MPGSGSRGLLSAGAGAGLGTWEQLCVQLSHMTRRHLPEVGWPQVNFNPGDEDCCL